MTEFGIRYNHDNTVLYYVPAITTLTILKTTKTIFGCTEELYAFKDAASTISSLAFESDSCLQEISDFSFYKCTELEKVDLSNCNKLAFIGKSAFQGCTKLNTVNIPNSIFKIKDFCFKDCITLTSIQFSQGRMEVQMGRNVFEGCSSLETITLPKMNSFRMTGSLFDSCTSLTAINVPQGSELKSNDGVLFDSYCSTIISMPAGKTGKYKVPESVNTLSEYAFKCSKLTSITFATNSQLSTISAYCFYGSSITQISLPQSVKSLYEYAFAHCESLEAVILNSGLETIGKSCFESCTNAKLTSITIPVSVNDFNGVFKNCKATITFEGQQYSKDNNNFLISNDNSKIAQYLGTATTITVPDTVTEIQENAFAESNIESIDLKNVEIINDFAFINCKQLKTITIPTNLRVIGKSAFENCISLENPLIFKNAINTLDSRAFFNCQKVPSVSFDESANIAQILPECFRNCINIKTFNFINRIGLISYRSFMGCSSLKEIELPESLSTVQNEAFRESGLEKVVFKGCTPSGGFSPYFGKKALGFPSPGMSSGEPIISHFCFYKCEKLSYVEIKGDWGEIGCKTFAFTKIRNITIPQSVKLIDDYCFQGCEALETVILKNDYKLADANYGAFSQCPSLRQFKIEEPLEQENQPGDIPPPPPPPPPPPGPMPQPGTEPMLLPVQIEQYALYNNDRTVFYVYPPKSSLKYFSFAGTVGKIRPGALMNCKNLEHVFIPQEIEEIGVSAFEGCTSLKYINIPSGVTKVCEKAFTGCNNLVCGLKIDNIKIPGFRTMLINAGMPVRCLRPCPLRTCNERSKISLFLFVATLIFD